MLFLAIIAYDLTALFTLTFHLLRKSDISKVNAMYIKCAGVVIYAFSYLKKSCEKYKFSKFSTTQTCLPVFFCCDSEFSINNAFISQP